MLKLENISAIETHLTTFINSSYIYTLNYLHQLFLHLHSRHLHKITNPKSDRLRENNTPNKYKTTKNHNKTSDSTSNKLITLNLQKLPTNLQPKPPIQPQMKNSTNMKFLLHNLQNNMPTIHKYKNMNQTNRTTTPPPTTLLPCYQQTNIKLQKITSVLQKQLLIKILWQKRL